MRGQGLLGCHNDGVDGVARGVADRRAGRRGRGAGRAWLLRCVLRGRPAGQRVLLLLVLVLLLLLLLLHGLGVQPRRVHHGRPVRMAAASSALC
jgi:hypothetical protein